MSQGIHGYFAQLFHPDFGNEAREGRMSIEAARIRIVGEGFSWEISIDNLEVTWDADINRVNFRDTSAPGICIVTYDEMVLRNPVLPELRELREDVEAARGRRDLSSRLKIIGWVLVAGVVLTFCFSWAMGLMVKAIANRVPPELEARFGEAALAEVGVDVKGLSFTNEAALVADLAKPLLAAMPKMRQQVKFYVVEDDEPNAFALPGGFVVVNTGLLQLLERPEELQGVLAHELAHVTERHVFRQVIAGAGPFLILSVFFNRGGVGSALAIGSGFVISQGFSKEYETEADDVGWRYLTSANIDPRGMISTFEKFQAADAGMLLPEGLSSHPLLEKRIARLRKKWDKLDRKDGFLTQSSQLWKEPARGERRR